jgi:ATP-dependent protease HslVU (ClpYQ) peptidase subunit
MTCIVATQLKNGKILIGADRQLTVNDDEVQVTSTPKVVKNNNIILAGCGNYALCYLITHVLEAPKKEPQTYTHDYIYGIFYDRVRKLLERHGYYDKDKLLKFSDQSDTEILIAVSNELFVMEFANEGTPEYPNGRINITPVSLPYTSGSGGAYALGALLALDRVKHDLTRAKDRVKIALEIAGEVSASCNRLIDFEVE